MTLVLMTAGLVTVAVTEEAAVPDPPEEVTIGEMSYWFAPVEFTHLDHTDLADDCTTCHHDQEPEDIGLCSDCHGLEYDPTEPEAPDLKMAYHQLCVGCHQQEEAPLACVDCHERKALPAGVELKEARQP